MEFLSRVVTPPGLIARARTWTLARDEGGFHVLHLGTAMVAVASANVGAAIANATVIPRMAKKLEVALAAAEQRLLVEGVAGYARSEPRSYYVPRASIQGIEYGTTGGDIPTAIVRHAKKLVLHCRSATPTQVRAFFAPLGG